MFSHVDKSASSMHPTLYYMLTVGMAVVLLFAPVAQAAGTLKVETPQVQEKSGEWHIKVRIDLPRPPATIHMPMRFTFAKTVVYERAIMEQGKAPELHKLQLGTNPKQIVPMDVDFADSRGQVFKATHFEFELKRAGGFFEAGEYLVQVSGSDGDVGTTQKLTLLGDNPTVYRGEMKFEQKVTNDVDAGKKEEVMAAPVSTDVAPVGSAPPMIPNAAFGRTEEEQIKEHPKGCGCFIAPRADFTALGAAAPLLFFALRRRGQSKKRDFRHSPPSC